MDTVSTLDASDTGQQGQLVRREAFGLVPHRRIPHYLLLESVLEQLCGFYESDDSRRKELYEGVRRQLRRLKLLDPTPELQELCSDTYLVRVWIVYLGQHLTSHFASMMLCTTRNVMNMTLKKLKKIAEGGFGIVCKARRRTDRQIYAVKKIPFKYCNTKVLKQVLREVELLAQLCHPNIVAYKSAWIENVTDFMTKLHSADFDSFQSTVPISSGNGDTSSLPYTFESSTFQAKEPKECQKQCSNSTSHEDCDSYASERCVSLEEPSKETVDIVCDSASVRRWKHSHQSSKSEGELIKSVDADRVHGRKTSSVVSGVSIVVTPQEHIFSLLRSSDVGGMLYIQMELCSKNLADWLAARNQRLADPESAESSISIIPEAMSIFKQILSGVEYVHSKGFIHRDIKPQNIMFGLEGSLVKLGDFGLATRTNQQESSTRQFPWASQSGHTQVEGTSLYAAPEQRQQASYDSKVDIYSLGLVLTELLCPFSTGHERITELNELREGNLPSALQAHSEDVVNTILAMCKSNPKERPSANELLISPLFIDKDKMIKELRAQLKEKDERLSSMAYELSLVKSTLEKVKVELKWYQDNSGIPMFSHNQS
ncbi:hypothetical protein MRX96_019195 [Rhipicephalus microplus]